MKFLAGHGRRRENPWKAEDRGFAGSVCWMFDGQPTRRYPAILGDDGAYDSAHRVFYKRHVGNVPEGHHVHHLCGESRCLNPEHLEALSMRQHLSLPNQRKRKYSNAELASFHTRNEAGESQASIARDLGIAQPGMSVLLRRYRKEILALER